MLWGYFDSALEKVSELTVMGSFTQSLSDIYGSKCRRS